MQTWTSTEVPCPRCGRRVGCCQQPRRRATKLQWTLRTLLAVTILAAATVAAWPHISYAISRGCRCCRERTIPANLKTIAVAQQDFMLNDHDKDRRQNFWVRDIYGLHALCPRGDAVNPNNMIRLIEPSTASADATRPDPWGGEVPVELSVGSFHDKGGYRYLAMTHHANGRAYDDGSGRNDAGYAVCAYPIHGGRRTYIMNETITIWWKETNGAPVLRWPADPAAEGWSRLE